jgi:hypothetical protein
MLGSVGDPNAPRRHGHDRNTALPGAIPAEVAVQDLSRLGIALRHISAVAVGREVGVDVPDAGGPLTGLVVRSEEGVVAIAFSEEPTMIARITQVLASPSATHEVA